MKIEGSERVGLPRARVWEMLNDPAVLKACTPGLESLEETSPDHFQAVLEVKVPALTGRFEGSADFVEREEPERMKIRLKGKGGPGFVDGHAELFLAESVPRECEVRYAADVQIGGQVARLGQRMIGGITKEMAGQFFETLGVQGSSPQASVPAPGARGPIAAFFQLAWRTLLNLLGLSKRS